MKQGIHPEYVECTVKCTCGNVFTTRSTKSELKIDICNKCHPFFTGTQKLIDTGGRVQRFADKFGSAADMVAKAEAEKKAAKPLRLPSLGVLERRAAKLRLPRRLSVLLSTPRRPRPKPPRLPLRLLPRKPLPLRKLPPRSPKLPLSSFKREYIA